MILKYMILKYQVSIHLIYLIFKNETVFREYFQQFFFFLSQKYAEKIRINPRKDRTLESFISENYEKTIDLDQEKSR